MSGSAVGAAPFDPEESWVCHRAGENNCCNRRYPCGNLGNEACDHQSYNDESEGAPEIQKGHEVV